MHASEAGSDNRIDSEQQIRETFKGTERFSRGKLEVFHCKSLPNRCTKKYMPFSPERKEYVVLNTVTNS
jgi:hypothetical protein